MMRRFFVFMMCAIMAITVVSCEPSDDTTYDDTEQPGGSGGSGGSGDSGDSGGSGDSGDSDDSTLSPGEHKAKLEDIALEFVNSFNLDDIEELTNVLYDLSDYLEYGDFPEYYSAMVNDLIIGTKSMSTAGFMSFATRATEDFIIDINDPDTNPYAGYSYTFDNDDYEWIEREIEDRSIKLKWDNSEALLSWNDTKKFEYEFDDVNYIVYVPKTITFTLSISSREHLKVVINTNITDIKTLAPAVEVNLNGGYVLTTTNSANSKGVESHSTIKKNGKTLMSSTAVVAANDVTDVDNWLKEEYDSYWDETYYYIEPDEDFVNNVKTGSAQIDILDLSIVASGDFLGMYEDLEELGDDYDDESKQYCQKVCNLLNEKVKASIVYNDTKEKVADVVMQVTSYHGYYDDEIYYSPEPILLFPDGSKYAFEDYFTEQAFGDLLDKLEEIADEVEDRWY